MRYYNIVMELTRKCNIQCEHCLRGSAEKLDMSDEVIEKTFEVFNDISALTLSGGEPSLVPEKIDTVCRNMGRVDSWYVVTNAVNVSTKFLESIKRLNDSCEDNEISALSVSNDQFHYNKKSNAIYKIEDFCEDNNIRVDIRQNIPYGRIINIGNAENNGVGSRDLSIYQISIEDEGDEYEYIDSDIYINAKGNIYGSCNLSYELQENPLLIIGNVLDENLDILQAIKEYNKRLTDNKIEYASQLYEFA